MRSILIISLLGCFFAAYEAKIFPKCELARKLKAEGMDGFHGYSLANCEYEPSIILSLLKEAFFPNQTIFPFHLVIYSFTHLLSCTPRMLLLSPPLLPCHSYQDLHFSLSTRDYLICNRFSSAVPRNHLPTQCP